MRVPVVLTAGDVRAVLERLDGVCRLVVSLLYGAGLRLQECLELRVKDIDFDRRAIVVRRGKGQKDRRTMLPDCVRELTGDGSSRFPPAGAAAIRDSDRRRGITCTSRLCSERWRRLRVGQVSQSG